MDNSAPLILYGCGSPNVRKVGILLEELGLSYELSNISVFAGDQFTPKFLEMNPFAKVPVLMDPELGQPLYESGAILFYLAERHGKFMPSKGVARFEVMQWLMVQMAGIGPMLGQLTHFRIVMHSGAEPYAEARYEEQSGRLYRQLEERLAGREWVAGQEYSIADMAIYPWSFYLEQHGFPAANYPNLLAWRQKISERPATIRSTKRFEQVFVDEATRTRRAATADDLDRFFGRTEDFRQLITRRSRIRSSVTVSP